MKERSKDSSKVKGLHKAADQSYNEQAGGLKSVGPILGLLTRLGSFAASPMSIAEPYKNGGVIAFYNPNATTAWITISSTAAAPAVPSAVEVTSIALKPNDYTVLATPDGTNKIACDTATVIAYYMEDDSSIG